MSENQKEKSGLGQWLTKGKPAPLPEPPARKAMVDNIEQPELPRPRRSAHDPEVQYNIRLPASLKKRAQRLVVEEEKPMGELLAQMLDLFEAHREQQRARRGDDQ